MCKQSPIEISGLDQGERKNLERWFYNELWELFDLMPVDVGNKSSSHIKSIRSAFLSRRIEERQYRLLMAVAENLKQ